MTQRQKEEPLVSVIVPTKNSGATLAACLNSIRQQTYKQVEIIVVDNSSTDDTPTIGKQLATKFFTQGPERSAQRNYGVSKASGEYVLIIDSDMELTPEVVGQCVALFQKDPVMIGIKIPEESFGIGFWAQCKKLEKSFYVGVDWMEAARAFHKDAYSKVDGYDITMISGEDWDLSQRVAKHGKLGHIDAFIMHNESHLKLITTMRKKYFYAKKFAAYMAKNKSSTNLGSQAGPITRYMLYFKRPGKLFENPILGVGMLLQKTCEFGIGALGLIAARIH